MFRKLRRFALFLLFVACGAALAIAVYVRTERFGALPEGGYLERIRRSPNWRGGAFRNLSDTPQAGGGSSGGMLKAAGFLRAGWRHLTRDGSKTRPPAPLPAVRTDLSSLPGDSLVWFGHSSYLMRVSGVSFLVDPVFGRRASPVPGTVVAFDGTDIYSPADMPRVDYLIISHDHWDHLDHQTMVALKDKVGRVVCGLGVGAHLRRWGFDDSRIVELDWGGDFKDGAVGIYGRPARHFSGRGFGRNQSLWMSYAVVVGNFRFYVGGDSGYDSHYRTIGEEFGPFDLAVLENGQYDANWRYIHESPEETSKAAVDLGARAVLPVHNSKFSISNHAWDAPMEGFAAASEGRPYRVLTPMIGEPVRLKDSGQVFRKWWRGVGKD